MPSRYTARILQHLAHEGYQPSSSKAVARDMRVPAELTSEFDAAVEALRDRREIVVARDGLLRLPRFEGEVVGKFRLNARGFGFVLPDKRYQEGDLFIPPDAVRDAITGDRVRAAVVRRDARRGRSESQRVSGRILEVLERGQEHFVGMLIHEADQWFVQPDGRALSEPVLIRDPHAKNAKAGDKVVIELLHYPDANYLPEGVIMRVLGEAGRPDVETEAVIAAHGLRTEFPLGALEQARAAAQTFEGDLDRWRAEREDLTNVFIFTIDPPDAKDFDDAITIAYDPKEKEWTLGVHIADVAHFAALTAPSTKRLGARQQRLPAPSRHSHASRGPLQRRVLAAGRRPPALPSPSSSPSTIAASCCRSDSPRPSSARTSG